MTYLTYVIDMKKNKTKLSQLPIIRKFPDIFSKELPRLSLEKKVEVSIDIY